VDIAATRIASQFKLCMCMNDFLRFSDEGSCGRYPMTHFTGMQRKIELRSPEQDGMHFKDMKSAVSVEPT
jgi:hypothetical protein